MKAKYFNANEFACKHCGQLPNEGIDPNLIKILDETRERLGVPLIISSGYRCPTHNANIGGASQSYHTKGKAADIYTNTIDSAKVYQIAYKVMQDLEIPGGHCHYPPGDGDFVHIDTRGYWQDGWL